MVRIVTKHVNTKLVDYENNENGLIMNKFKNEFSNDI